MKKVLLLMMFVLATLTATAQRYDYRAQEFAFGTRTTNGAVRWGNWESSSIRLCIDLDNSRFYVYSNLVQVYRVTQCGNWHGDGQGGQEIDFKVIDQDGDRGTCRLRIERNGTSQFYVFFNNCAWCYSRLVLY